MHSEGVAGGDQQRSASRPFVEGSTACGSPQLGNAAPLSSSLAELNWLTDSPPGEVLADGVVSPATATVPEALTVQWFPPKHLSRIKRSQICRGVGSVRHQLAVAAPVRRGSRTRSCDGLRSRLWRGLGAGTELPRVPFRLLDVVYCKPPTLRKFKVLELIARVP